MAELAAGGDLEQAMASEAISSQLRRLTQNWTICVQAREPPTRKSAARIRRSVATEDSACDRRARSTRCQRPAMPPGSAQLPWSGRCAASRLACARRRGGASPTAPGCAAARCIRALPPCWRARRAYAAPPAQPAGRQDGGPRKQSWPDPLRRRQESPAKGTTQPHQCKGQGGGEGTFFLVRAFWVRLGIRLQ